MKAGEQGARRFSSATCVFWEHSKLVHWGKHGVIELHTPVAFTLKETISALEECGRTEAQARVSGPHSSRAGKGSNNCQRGLQEMKGLLSNKGSNQQSREPLCSAEANLYQL